MTRPRRLTAHPAHAALLDSARALRRASLQSLFDGDATRAGDFALEAAGLRLDYARQLLDREALERLLALAREAELERGIAALFAGEPLNNTEERPALHTLLRAEEPGPGANGERFREVVATRERMAGIARDMLAGRYRGYDGAAITDVVNIGIGGSDLGPRLVTEALQPFAGPLRCHYVANVDPADLAGTLGPLDPRRTLFIVCSKSFRTEETLANSTAAREWMLDGGARPRDLERHFLAVTTNLEAAAAFGIPPANCLPMWDWVGGRYSVWSAVGLSCAIALGWEHFEDFLGGARAMDRHFLQGDPALNMPVLLALLEIWNGNFLGAGSHVVLPYDHDLRHLPDYLQQLTMESNGKRVGADGAALDYATAPVLWGAAGTIGQHSFHQLLHQGTNFCPVDFILPLRTHTGKAAQHRRMVANCLAQSRALMVGRSRDAAHASLLERGLGAERAAALAPHLEMPGNRPSSIITLDAVTPATLGALLALYEHRTFCSGWLWGINPFDQWGVELGKEIGAQVLQRLAGEPAGEAMDPATERQIAAWREQQERD